MAYDEKLADRIRELLEGEPDLSEKRMFGGLSFLLSGNMAVAVGKDGLMVRVDKADSDKFTAADGIELVVMRGREMRGWLDVPADKVRTARQLGTWVRRGAAFAKSLPAK